MAFSNTNPTPTLFCPECGEPMTTSNYSPSKGKILAGCTNGHHHDVDDCITRVSGAYSRPQTKIVAADLKVNALCEFGGRVFVATDEGLFVITSIEDQTVMEKVPMLDPGDA